MRWFLNTTYESHGNAAQIGEALQKNAKECVSSEMMRLLTKKRQKKPCSAEAPQGLIFRQPAWKPALFLPASAAATTAAAAAGTATTTAATTRAFLSFVNTQRTTAHVFAVE